jgi:hypothetical protein
MFGVCLFMLNIIFLFPVVHGLYRPVFVIRYVTNRVDVGSKPGGGGYLIFYENANRYDNMYY